jgi:predicted permease
MVALVLFIACANVANLMLSRAIARRKDLVIRSALGAGRLRLIRLQVVESLVLAGMAGVLGIVLARVAGPVLAGFAPAGDVPVNTEHGWDWRIYAFTVVVSALAGIAAGLWPALEASRFHLTEALKEGGGAGTGGARHPVLNLLVVGQVMLSVVVLACAGLFGQSLRRMQGMALGFRADDVLMMSLDLGRQRYPDARGRQFLDSLLERAAALPGVRGATLTQHVPFDYGMQITEVSTGGDLPGSKDGYVSSAFTIVGPDFFQTMGTALTRGRVLDRRDDAGSRRVAVVNATMARTFWPGRDPVGQRFRFGRGGDWIEVVGVAEDGKYVMMAEAPRTYFYLPLAQNYRAPITLMLRTAGDPGGLARPVQELIRQMDPDLPVFNVRTMDRHIRESIFALMPLRLAATMAAFEGVLGLLLATMGLYAVVAYAARRRVHEIGVRIAIGARPADVVRLVVGKGMRLAVTGLVLGLLVAVGVGFALSHALYGLDRVAASVLVPVAVLLLAVAALACYVPARRATRVDPVTALR